ncbi:hypothetical protein PoB_002665500 [Plakobranchus ocellatus]|uniref:Uncharacterized protein n=1 Tax=Plakobranchus ocellatus TaxID=259542 RepID=A0AAV3ZZR1_9GAST|nr:hypothetical protein PoB_002665500 [Plakobranchus ocellatus]
MTLVYIFEADAKYCRRAPYAWRLTAAAVCRALVLSTIIAPAACVDISLHRFPACQAKPSNERRQVAEVRGRKPVPVSLTMHLDSIGLLLGGKHQDSSGWYCSTYESRGRAETIKVLRISA